MEDKMIVDVDKEITEQNEALPHTGQHHAALAVVMAFEDSIVSLVASSMHKAIAARNVEATRSARAASRRLSAAAASAIQHPSTIVACGIFRRRRRTA